MTRLAPSFTRSSQLYPDAVRPCGDCDASAVLLSQPMPDGARVMVVHDESCPWLAAYEQEQR